MGSKERRERARSETRRLILDAAREILLAEGPGAVTTRRIAQRIDYTAAALYGHFKDKDALMRELCLSDFTNFAQAFLALPAADDPVERLRGFAHAYLRFALEHPAPYHLLFMTPRLPVPENGEDEPGLAVYSMLVAAVREAQERLVLHPQWTDAERVAQALWSALHGVVSLHMVVHKDGGAMQLHPPEALADTLMAVLMEGFRRPPPG